MFLPTILATLFLFTAVIALNKLTSMSNDKLIRLINVDDVFPTKADAERNSRKEFWELPPPPSPESVIARQASQPAPQSDGGPIEETGLDEMAAPSRATPAAIRPLPLIDAKIKMPEVQPDTSLPGSVKP